VEPVKVKALGEEVVREETEVADTVLEGIVYVLNVALKFNISKGLNAQT
jgi:hypothetical protein